MTGLATFASHFILLGLFWLSAFIASSDVWLSLITTVALGLIAVLASSIVTRRDAPEPRDPDGEQARPITVKHLRIYNPKDRGHAQ